MKYNLHIILPLRHLFDRLFQVLGMCKVLIPTYKLPRLKFSIFVILFLISFSDVFSQTNFRRQVVTGTDDCEEHGPDTVDQFPGYIDMSSTALELVRDDNGTSNGAQIVGIRFTNMAIPPGAIITQAKLVFISAHSGSSNSGACNINIQAQASDNPPTFSPTTFNVSSRPRTAASVNWIPASWTNNTEYLSPDIKSLVQEIVNRPGWASNNAMAFIITGSGTRTAYAFEKDAGLAPQIIIEYILTNPIALSTSSTPVLCRNESTGAITLNVSGGTPGYTYDWSHNGPQHPDTDPKDLSGMPAGFYVVTVTDAAGLTGTATTSITQPGSVLSVTPTINNVSSPGGTNGSITLVASGGTPEYTYSWAGGATTSSRSGLAAGSYTVTTSDANGCQIISSNVVGTNANNAIVNKQLYLSDGLTLDRLNPGATPLDNSTSVTSQLGVGSGGVSLNNVSTLTSSEFSSTFNLTHTVSMGLDRLLLVSVATRDKNVTSVTYGGMAMTRVSTYSNNNFSIITMYKLVNPTSGTANVTVNLSGFANKGVIISATDFIGVNQTNPLGVEFLNSGTSTTPTVSVSSVSGDLVYGIMSVRNASVTATGSGQTLIYNLGAGEMVGHGSSKTATSTTTTISNTISGSQHWAIIGIAIKPSPSLNTITFTQNPDLCSPLTIKANNPITLSTHVGIVSGTMPANPNITAVMKYGATTIITLTNPTYNSITGIMTWTGTRGSDITIPAGQAIALQFTVIQTGVVFQIRHDSQIYPSKITFPVSSFVNVSSILIYNASYPNGVAVTDIPNLGNSYIRFTVTDPFGAYDISGLTLTLTKPDNSTVNINLGDEDVVENIACGKIYEYEWSNPSTFGTWDINGSGKEGSEGVTHSLNVARNVIVPTGPVMQYKQLYLSDPSQALDRIDPVNTNDLTTAQTVTMTNTTNNLVSFIQNPVLCSALTIQKNQVITVSNFVSIISGTMPANPAITAELKYGSTVIATINNPTYTSNLLTWTIYLANDVTIPAGQALTLVITTAQSGVTFRIDYDSKTKPSKIDLPVVTYINLNSLDFYNAAFPEGTVITNAANGSTVYFRAVVSDPFGANDITGLNINISPISLSTSANSIGTSGCTRTYQYTWNTPTVSGDYNLIATAKEGYENTVIDVKFKGFSLCPLTVNSSVINPTCYVLNGGQANLNVTGGSSPYIWNWSRVSPSGTGSGTGIQINDLIAGTYNVTVTGERGCTGVHSFVVSPASGPTVNINGNNTGTYCNDGSIELEVLNGSGNYSYFWADGYYTKNRNNLTPDEYSVSVTDVENGCITTASTMINLGSPIQQNLFTLQPTCSGSNNGAFNLSPAGGTGVYTYNWTGGVTTKNRSNLSPGNYFLTITDNGGCSFVFLNTITAPSPISLVLSKTDATCVTTGAIAVTTGGGTGPYSYNWADMSGSFNPKNRTDLFEGTYSLTVTDFNGCTIAQSINLALPTCDNTGFIVCKTNLAERFSVAYNPDVSSYTWTVPAGATIISGQGTLSILVNWSGSTVTTGQICVSTSNVCGSGSNICQIVYIKTTASTATVNDPVCTGNNIELFATGGTTYVWSGPNSFTSNEQNPIIYTAVAGNTGTYTVTVTNENGCTSTSSVVVNVRPNPSVSAAIANATSCSIYTGSVVLTPSGGTSPYTYLWDNGSVSKDLIEITVGVYDVSVTDAFGCRVQRSNKVALIEGISTSISKTNVTCFGSNNGTGNTIIVSGSGSYQYQWSHGPTTQNVTGLSQGIYRVTVTDLLDGCHSIEAITITQPNQLQVSKALTNVNCFGATTGSITLTVTGGSSPYTYIWTGGATTKDRLNIAAGNYTVTITDGNSCQTIINSTITQPASALSQTATIGHVTCFDAANGYVNLSITGGNSPFNFLWSGGQTTQYLVGLNPGTYTATITDSKGCNTITSRTVTSPAALTISDSKTNIACFGNMTGSIILTPTGGTTPYTYVWSNGATTKDLSGLAAGSYTVSVTDSKTCMTTRNIVISEPTLLLVSASTTNVLCFGNSTGLIDITVTGGSTPYAFNWSTGATVEDLTSRSAGTYTVTVSDANTCSFILQRTITQPIARQLSGIISHISCNGSSNGAINLNVTGGVSPYSYLWSNSSTQKDLSNLISGTFTVTVTDANACLTTANYVVTQPAALLLTTTPTHIGCFEGSGGAVSLSVSGGNEPYQYSWSNGYNTQNINALFAGTYTVTVVDYYGCSATSFKTVSQPAILAATGTHTDNCAGQNNGTISISPTGGTLPYTYTWSDAGPNSGSRNSLASGTYGVTITDLNGCTKNLSFTLSGLTTQSLTKVPSCDQNPNGSAYLQNNGEIYIQASGGSSGYSYAWSTGATSSYLLNLSNGTYTVTVSSGTCQQIITTNLDGIACIPPVAVDDNFIIETNLTLNGSVAPNDYDPNTESPLTFLPMDFIGPEIGVITWNNQFNGDFIFTPTDGYAGNFTIQYQVCDTLELCARANLNIIVERPVLGVAKTIIGQPSNQGNGLYHVTYSILVENKSALTLSSVQVEENLSATFAGATSFAVLSISSSNFTVNSSNFNGTSNINLLSGSNSLAPNTSGTILLNVSLTPGSNIGPYNNTAIGKAYSPSGILYTDLSQNGTLTDPDNDGDPTNNNESTPLLFCPIASLPSGNTLCMGASVTMQPSGNGNWVSSNPAVATINSSGVITGVGIGSTNILYSQSGCLTSSSALINVIGGTAIVTGTTSMCIGSTTTLSPTTGGIWSSSNPGVATVNNTGVVTGVSYGSATFTFANMSTGCVTSPSQVVTISNLPMVSISGPTNICIGTTTQLSPSAGGTWTSSNPAVATVTNSGLVTGISQGVVNFTFSLGVGCVSQPTTSVTVNGKPSVFILGSSEICPGTTTTLLPSSGGTWTSSNPLVASVTNSGIVTGLSSGSATAIFTYSNSETGCISDPTPIITIKTRPVVNITGSSTICTGLTTTLSPTSGGIWTSSNNAIATVTSGGLVFGNAPGEVTFTFRDNATECLSYPTSPVTVNAIPLVSVTGPSTICAGATSTLSPSTGGTWVSSNVNIATVTNGGIVTGITAGSATFTFTSSSTNCVSNATSQIIVIERPIANLVGINSLCIGNTTNLTPSSGGTWTSNNPAVATISNSGMATAVSGGTATFYFTNSSSGCSSASSVPITVNGPIAFSLTGPSSICVGETTTVSPSSGGTWTSSSPSIATVTNTGLVTGLTNGLVNLTFITSSGCSYGYPLQVVVNGKPSITISGPQEICIGSVTNLLPSTGGTWVSNNPAVATITNAGLITGIAQGSTTFIFTNSATGCMSIPSTVITVNGKPSVSISGPTNICEGSTTNLTPTVGGVWSSNSPLIASVNNSGMVSGISGGTATFVFTQTSTGCISNPTNAVTVNPKPVATLTNNNPICIGATTNLTPTSGGSWVSMSPSIASVTSGGLVTGLSAGSTRFVFTSSVTGCMSNQSALLNVLAKPMVSITGSDQICTGGTTTLFPVSGGTWVSNNPSVATVSGTGIVTAVSSGSTTFRFTDSTTGCVSDNSNAVSVNSNPTISMPTTNMCAGHTMALSPSSGGIWTSNNPLIATVNSTGLVTTKTAGNVTFTFTNLTSQCNTVLVSPVLSITSCFAADYNITTVNVSVNGDLRTNDNVPEVTIYGSPATSISSPLGSIKTLTINSNGTYNFIANTPGEYIYQVPVCVSGVNLNCPTTLLRIFVTDSESFDKTAVANLDRAVTYSNANSGLPGIPVTLQTMINDFCVYGSGCSLDPLSVSVITPPLNGTYTIASNGNIIYTPNAGFTGIDILTYKICVLGSPTNCTNSVQIIEVLSYESGAPNITFATDDSYTSFQETSITGNVKINDYDPEGDIQTVQALGSVGTPININGGKYYINSSGDFTFIPNPGFSGPTSFVYTTCDNNAEVACAKATVYILVIKDLSLQIRVYLEGALINNSNARTADNRPLMRDNLRVSPFTGQNIIPLMDPYVFKPELNISQHYTHKGQGGISRFQTITNPEVIFAVTGQNALIDWVFVELRSKTNKAQVLSTRAGLLQRDGDIVDLDGISPLAFPGMATDSFYVVVRHRNHLGAMTQIMPSNTLIDLTSPTTSIFDFGTSLGDGYNYTNLAMNSNTVNGYRALWAGDFDGDGRIKFVNPNDDNNILFFDVFTHVNNLGYTTNFNLGHGYYQGDFDMNAKVKYDNPNDDKNLLYGQVLLCQLNSNILSNFNYFIQQVPPSN